MCFPKTPTQQAGAAAPAPAQASASELALGGDASQQPVKGKTARTILAGGL